MPVMDGKQCLNEILRIKPDAKVVRASGHSDGGLANASKGVMGFVQKPYNMRELLITIREVLDKD